MYIHSLDLYSPTPADAGLYETIGAVVVLSTTSCTSRSDFRSPYPLPLPVVLLPLLLLLVEGYRTLPLRGTAEGGAYGSFPRSRPNNYMRITVQYYIY